MSDKVKAYECEHCVKAYVHQSGLCNHIKKHHPEIKGSKKSSRKIIEIKPTVDYLKCFTDEEYLDNILLNRKLTGPYISEIVNILKDNVSMVNGSIYYMDDDEIVNEYINDELMTKTFVHFTEGFKREYVRRILENNDITAGKKLTDLLSGLNLIAKEINVLHLRGNVEKLCINVI